jgi:hypothetical protein
MELGAVVHDPNANAAALTQADAARGTGTMAMV